MGFQTEVNLTPAPAVAGDFASANPRSTVLAGPGGLVTGSEGVTVGKFAWVEEDGVTVNNFGSAPNAPDGFVHRDQQALITLFLEEAANVVPKGFPITLHNSGDFWALNNGPAALTKGASIYAGYADGGIYSAAPAGTSFTGAIGSTSTGTAVAGKANQITISAVTGLISIGDSISGTGVTAGTVIVAQISGTPGGAGVYELSEDNTAAADTITTFGTTLNVTAVASGTLAPGMPVTGTNVPANASIASQVSGATGGVGVYTLTVPATEYVASEAMTTAGGVETNWKAVPTSPGDGAVGALVKISTYAN